MDAIIFTDGASRGNPGPSGAGVVIMKPGGEILLEKSDYIGEGTCNRAEYKALIIALKEAKKLGLKKVLCMMDSKLVAHQSEGKYKVKAASIRPYNDEVRALSAGFDEINFEWIPREENTHADSLSVQAVENAIKDISVTDTVLKKYNLKK